MSCTVRLAAVTTLVAGLLLGCGTIPTPAPVEEPPSSGQVRVPTGGSAPPPAPVPAARPVEMVPNVKAGAAKVPVDTLLDVTARAGTLSSVSVTYRSRDSDGETERGTINGALSADRLNWRAAGRLEPGATYEVAMTGTNASNQGITKTTTTFTTQALSLDQQTFPTLIPFRDDTVGVGMPVMVNFDVPVTDRAEVERHLRVTSTPKQEGVWSWFSDTEVHFRPRTYWKPGTRVTAEADINGINVGNGIYGQKSASTEFVVGPSLVTKIDLGRKRAQVYRDGKLARTIAVSGGQPGWTTRSGTKLIMEKKSVTRMTSDAIGAAEEYNLRVRYALRMTWSGEFMHAAPWNAASFGRRNASHGCVGMSTADASWLFSRVRVGDPVVTTGTSRGLERGNGWTDWDVSYAEYAKGSAL